MYGDYNGDLKILDLSWQLKVTSPLPLIIGGNDVII
jgi:hypothetical protein